MRNYNIPDDIADTVMEVFFMKAGLSGNCNKTGSYGEVYYYGRWGKKRSNYQEIIVRGWFKKKL